MKQLITIVLILVSYCLNAQGISENLSRTEYYENILDYTITNKSLDYYKKPHNNGYKGQNYSSDEKYLTFEYKLIDMDRLLVVKNSSDDNISKVIFIISPDVKNSDTSFRTDKSIIEYLNMHTQTIESDKKWKTNLLLFEHFINSDGIGMLVITYY